MRRTVSSKGQITIPAEIRELLGLRAGTPVIFETHARGLLLRKGTKGEHPADALFGSLRLGTSVDGVLEEMRRPRPRCGTITVKIPGSLVARLGAQVRRRATTQSAVIRQALEAYLEDSAARGGRRGSCLDLGRDLAGSLRGGPRDLSSDKRHVRGYGRSRGPSSASGARSRVTVGPF